MTNLELAAVILTTLGETGESPEGIMYAGLMGVTDIDTFKAVTFALVSSGLLERTGLHRLRITSKGRELAAKIESAIKERKEAVNA